MHKDDRCIRNCNITDVLQARFRTANMMRRGLDPQDGGCPAEDRTAPGLVKQRYWEYLEVLGRNEAIIRKVMHPSFFRKLERLACNRRQEMSSGPTGSASQASKAS